MSVSRPEHYKGTDNIECIEAIEMIFGREAVKLFALCNAFKYIWRCGQKEGGGNIPKALWYIDFAKNNYHLTDHEKNVVGKMRGIIKRLAGDKENEKSVY